MKSKISFINRTMLQKNVKLYWPIWTLYTIVLLLNGPFPCGADLRMQSLFMVKTGISICLISYPRLSAWRQI